MEEILLSSQLANHRQIIIDKPANSVAETLQFLLVFCQMLMRYFLTGAGKPPFPGWEPWPHTWRCWSSSQRTLKVLIWHSQQNHIIWKQQRWDPVNPLWFLKSNEQNRRQWAALSNTNMRWDRFDLLVPVLKKELTALNSAPWTSYSVYCKLN